MKRKMKKGFFLEINPLGVIGKYIYHLIFVKFRGLRGKWKPKYIFDSKKMIFTVVVPL